MTLCAFQKSQMNQKRTPKQYPLRTCYSLHECRLCGMSITYGQLYYDGGYGRREHEKCRKNADIYHGDIDGDLEGAL